MRGFLEKAVTTTKGWSIDNSNKIFTNKKSQKSENKSKIYGERFHCFLKRAQIKNMHNEMRKVLN